MSGEIGRTYNCDLCGKKMPALICYDCKYKTSMLIGGCWEEVMNKTYMFEITYQVSGTEHDGYCSDCEDERSVSETEVMVLPIIDLLEVETDKLQAGLTFDSDDFLSTFGKYARYYSGEVSCSNGSGYCGTSKDYTISTVRVVRK